MKYKVAIRADGNSEIGMGHISRCLSIADALRTFNVQPVFLLSDSNACGLLDENDMDYKVLGVDYRKIGEDVSLVQNFLKDNQISFILVDSYYASDQYLLKLMESAHVACIDGLYKYNAEVDLVINYNAAATLEFYQSRFLGKKTELLIGPQYTPLKPEYWDIKDVHKQKFGNKVLITSGSTDPLNICGNILSAGEQTGLFTNLNITVVIGPFFQQRDNLLKEWEMLENIRFIQNCNDLLPLMMDTCVAVSAAGTTAYELLRLEVPTILFAMADNQLSSEALSDKVTWIGDVRNPVAEGEVNHGKVKEILASLEKLCFSKADYTKAKEKCRGYIDGQGAIRIAESIINILERSDDRKKDES